MSNHNRKLFLISALFLLILIIPASVLFISKHSVVFEVSEISSRGTPEVKWVANGTVISNEKNHQITPQICSDGAGGAIITWEDQRDTANGDIYAQRINLNEGIEWIINGSVICNISAGSLVSDSPQITSDGLQGAIIAWLDGRTAWMNIYAQRINSSGGAYWTLNGTKVSSGDHINEDIQMCSDGDGGAIITWKDERDSPTDEGQIYAQRLNSTGHRVWLASDTPICNANGTQQHPRIVSDNAGGVYITWQDNRTGTWDIYAQHVNSNGITQWTANGTVICNATNNQFEPELCRSFFDGPIITWYDYRGGSGSSDIYVQWLNTAAVPQWGSNGTAVCNKNLNQFFPQIINDESGGAIITWQDYRNSKWDIYAQQMNLTGESTWIANGTIICNKLLQQTTPQLCTDGDNGAIITWKDNSVGTNDIYAQWIDKNGVTQWNDNGTAICTELNEQQNQKIISDDDGGAIITWLDKRGPNDDIYAQRVTEKASGGGPDETGIPGFALMFSITGILILLKIKWKSKIKS